MYIFTPILAIEVSRKCNLRCAHCMRGDARSESVSETLVSRLFDEVVHAKMLVLSGGEPFLCYDEIKLICEVKKRKRTKISSVVIVTNGTVYDERIYKLLEEHFEKIEVDISTDSFHRESIDEIYKKGVRSNNPRLCPACFDDVYDNMELHIERGYFGKFLGDSRNIINMGRALDVEYSKVHFEPLGYFWTDFSSYLNFNNVIGVGPRIYMDALGYITEGNSSYDVREDMSIGNIQFNSLSELILKHGIHADISSLEEFTNFAYLREKENYDRSGKLYAYKDNKVVEVKRDAVLSYSPENK